MVERQDECDGELNAGMFFAGQAVIVNLMSLWPILWLMSDFLSHQPCQLQAA